MRTWLQELRTSKGYTQQKMADKLGVTVQYYNFIEAGKRQMQLDLVMASKLSNIFKISLKKINEYEEALREQKKGS
jgi:transcriptional regulator with XRE-family HTH domain